ncbi:MAG TPA: helix-hairpin-helix domain-containing protein [Acidimicrobiales bacterium]|nr:helix-hairpin-helix domain-containing protein [Acidimicrobiales bacterium]
MRLRERSRGGHVKRRSGLGDEASRVDRRPQISRRTGWSLADSLRLLEHHYRDVQPDQVIDLTLFGQEPRSRPPTRSGSAAPQRRPLDDIAGVGPATASVLADHGFTEIRSVAAAGVADLARVPGFGSVRAAAVKAAAEALTSR